jgi:hypothetical protein
MSGRQLAIIPHRQTDPQPRIVLRLAPLHNPVPNKGPLLNRTFKKGRHPSLKPSSDPLRNREFRKDRRLSLKPNSDRLLKLVRRLGPLLSQRRERKKGLSRKEKNRRANLASEQAPGKSLVTPGYAFVLLAVDSGGTAGRQGGVLFNDALFASRICRRRRLTELD